MKKLLYLLAILLAASAHASTLTLSFSGTNTMDGAKITPGTIGTNLFDAVAYGWIANGSGTAFSGVIGWQQVTNIETMQLPWVAITNAPAFAPGITFDDATNAANGVWNLGTNAVYVGATNAATGAAYAATNALGGLAAFSATSAFDASGTALNATNGLTSALLVAKIGASVYDAYGVALNATNGLGTAAFKATGYFDLAGAGTTAAQNATNALAGLAAFSATSAFDASGTALNATNGLNAALVTQIQNATNNSTLPSSVNATNGLSSSLLSGKIGAGVYDASGVALNATNGLNSALSTTIQNSTNGLNTALVTQIQNATNNSTLPASVNATNGITASMIVSKLGTGVLNSNVLDTATAAQLALAGGGSVAYATAAGTAYSLTSTSGTPGLIILSNATATPITLYASNGVVTASNFVGTVGWSNLPAAVLTNSGAFDASSTALNATNGLNGALVTQIQNATNNSILPSSLNATNGLFPYLVLTNSTINGSLVRSGTLATNAINSTFFAWVLSMAGGGVSAAGNNVWTGSNYFSGSLVVNSGGTSNYIANLLVVGGPVAATAVTNTGVTGATVLGTDANGKIQASTAPYVMTIHGSISSLLAASTTVYLPASGCWCTNMLTSDTSGRTRTVFTRAGTLKNLYVVSSAAASSGKTHTLTIMTNGVASNVVVTLNNATSGNDTSDTIPNIAGGTEIGMKIVSSSSATASAFEWGFEVTGSTTP